VPLAAVQKQVGHRSLQTTEIYLRLADEDVRKAYESVRWYGFVCWRCGKILIA